MAELVTAIPLGQLGVSGISLVLLAVIVRAIVKGDLVPRAVVDDHMKIRDDRITYLVTALDLERDGHTETRQQVTLLSRAGGTSATALEEIRKEGDR